MLSYTRVDQRVRAVCVCDKRPRQVAGARAIDASAPRIVDSWGERAESRKTKHNADWELSEKIADKFKDLDCGQGKVRNKRPSATSDSWQRNRMAVNLDAIFLYAQIALVRGLMGVHVARSVPLMPKRPPEGAYWNRLNVVTASTTREHSRSAQLAKKKSEPRRGDMIWSKEEKIAAKQFQDATRVAAARAAREPRQVQTVFLKTGLRWLERAARDSSPADRETILYKTIVDHSQIRSSKSNRNSATRTLEVCLER
jgi:hypothetical protein